MIEHLPIVRFIARRIHERLPQHVPIEDLYSAGVVGLLDAFGKFDPSKQVQFRSYAQFRIRGAILDSLRTLDWSPRELRRKGRAIEQAIQALTAQFGRSPSDTEIAKQLQIDLAAYQQLLGELKGLEIGTLHSERSDDSGEEELAYLPNRPEDDPLFRYLHGEVRRRLTEAIGDLPERERLVMTLYYYEETTMKEIGLILGVVESRISQIHASAILHLRAGLADFAIRQKPTQRRVAAPLCWAQKDEAPASVTKSPLFYIPIVLRLGPIWTKATIRREAAGAQQIQPEQAFPPRRATGHAKKLRPATLRNARSSKARAV